MSPKRRKFPRDLGRRPYRKLFVIATEGIKTERDYFSMFKTQHSVIRCLPSKHSAPSYVLKRMKEYLNQERARPPYEAWIVVDKDQWSDQQLAQLYEWSKEEDNYGFALSNPNFEYWLLLHFEDGSHIHSSQVCSERLKRYLPDYDKGIDAAQITSDRINAAIRRAKVSDNPPCEDWPRTFGCTTVYKLVENIRQS